MATRDERMQTLDEMCLRAFAQITWRDGVRHTHHSFWADLQAIFVVDESVADALCMLSFAAEQPY